LPDRSQVFGAVAGDGVDEVVKLILGICIYINHIKKIYKIKIQNLFLKH
jgi:hypothetical protein